MLKVIMGVQGSGKTKQLIELVNATVKKSSGNVVCIEKGEKLRYQVKPEVRLMDITEYAPEQSFDTLYAYICGMYSGDYDIETIFIDSLFKVSNCSDIKQAEIFLEKLNAFTEKSGVNVTITISSDINNATDCIKKFF